MFGPWFSSLSLAAGVSNFPHTGLGGTAEPQPDELMVAYQKGDETAFTSLYRALGPPVMGYLIRLTRDRARAEDLLQITFAKVHRARASFLAGARVKPWVLAIARRSFLDEQRRRAIRREEVSRDGFLPEPEPEAAAQRSSEMADGLEAALAALPPSYGEAIVLTKITGLSVREAAEVLGTSEVAVRLRVHRGYGLLRETLGSSEESK
jgi:RNA polymerase sigma-70 factor, ECF subfamily